MKVYICSQYPFYSMGNIRRFGHELRFNKGLYKTDDPEEQKVIESDNFFIAGIVKIAPDGEATPAPIVNSHLGMVSASIFTDEQKEHAVTGNPQPKAQPAKAEDIELEVLSMTDMKAMHRDELIEYAQGIGLKPGGRETREQLKTMIIDKTGR